MPLLRCTNKLLAEIDDEPSQELTADSSPLGDWYGHIFTVERRKCIMFINEPTFFVCPILGIVKTDYRQIVPFFKKALATALRVMKFSPKESAWVLRLHEDVQIGNAINRSTMGSLNNRISDTKYIIPYIGGFDVCDPGRITVDLNKTPMKPIGYSYGVERMRIVVEEWMK